MNEETGAGRDRSPELSLAHQNQILEELRNVQADQHALLKQLLQERQEQREALEDALERVKVTDFNMPFISLVGFFIKATLAAIPASIILGILALAVLAVLGGGLAALGLALGS